MSERWRGACFDAAKAAAGGSLDDSEVMAAFKAVADEADRLRAEGKTDRFAERLKEFAAREAEQAKLAAVIRKRNAILSAMRQVELRKAVTDHLDVGLTPKQSILALMEGTTQGIAGGRNSVGALTLAYEARYTGGLMRDLQRDVPGWRKLLADPDFDRDVFREMWELKEGGKPGVTGNKTAREVASIFASYAELARGDLNAHGANIRKLGGWAGTQVHDTHRMLLAGKSAWIDSVLPHLDLERTFGRPGTANVREALGEVFSDLVSGVRDTNELADAAGRPRPSDLAKALSKSRVLHFKNADAALAYREQFGHSNTVGSIAAYLRSSARSAAVLERFGPNPESTFTKVVADLRRDIESDDGLSAREKERALAPLRTEGITRGTRSSIQAAFDVMTGAGARPDNITWSKVGNDIRAAQNMAKLGGALFSSLAPDTVTTGLASMFRGSGFFKGMVRQIDGVMRGRPKGEQAELAFLFGEGFDGLIGHIANQAHATDVPLGRMARWQETFFRLNGLNWWTDVGRSVAARTVAAEMGMRSSTAYDALPAAYRHVLGMHGITAAKWDAVRSAGVLHAANGKRYVTPDLIRDLDDAVIDPLIADRLERVRAEKADAPDLAERERALRDDMRRELELDVLRFVADETNYGVIETDNASRRLTTANGLRPGTIAGEAVRFVMQFKGFPTAFTQRVIGRTFKGYGAPVRGGSMAGRIARRFGRAATTRQGSGIAALVVGMTMAGYMSNTLNDLRKGRWPPRDPTDPDTWAAAMLAGGALGIYGDFLIGETNRNGSGILATVAGPAPGTLADLIEMVAKAPVTAATDPDALPKPSRVFELAVQNTPGANLWWLRPALDTLILNEARDLLAPGTLDKKAGYLKSATGQKTVFPRTVGEMMS